MSQTDGYFIDWNGKARSTSDPGGGYLCDVDAPARYVAVTTKSGTLVHEATLYRTLADIGKAGIKAELVPGSHPWGKPTEGFEKRAGGISGEERPMDKSHYERRYFVTYRGVKLPSTMVSEIDAAALTNRNTHICAYYDGAGRLRSFEKWVYGEIELIHRYNYDDAGALTRAEIEVADEDIVVLNFDETKRPAPSRVDGA